MAGYGNSGLHVLHVIFYILTSIGGLMCCLGIGWSGYSLNDNCPLYSKMAITKGTNKTVSVDLIGTQWASSSYCSFCLFTGICTTAFGIIWLWFYLLFTDRKKIKFNIQEGPPPDVRLLLPSLFFVALMWILCVIALNFIRLGRNHWCNGIVFMLGETCNYVSEVTWIGYPEGHLVYRYLNVALVGCMVSVVCLSLLVIIVGNRMYEYTKWHSEQQKQLEDERMTAANLGFMQQSLSDQDSLEHEYYPTERNTDSSVALGYSNNPVI